MGDVKTYNRTQRKDMLKALMKRRNILIGSKLLANKTYQQLTEEEFLELRTGKCTDAERQEVFNKVRKVVEELFNIDTKINEIKYDLANKYSKQNERQTTSKQNPRP